MDEQKVTVNYWKEIKKDLQRVLNEVSDMVLIIHNAAEIKQIAGFIGSLPSSRMIYISLTKTFDSVKEQVADLGQTVLVVDCVSSGLMEKQSNDEAVYADAPEDLQATINLIESAVKQFDAGFIVIDSLSQLIDFSDLSNTSKDTHTFYEKLKELSSAHGLRFALLYDENQLMSVKNLPSFHMQTILRMEVRREEQGWSNFVL